MSSMGLDQKSFPRLLRIPFILFVGIEQGTELCVLGLMGDILHFRLRSWEACLAKRRLSRWYPRRSRRFGGCVDDGRLGNSCDFFGLVVLTCRDTDTRICG